MKISNNALKMSSGLSFKGMLFQFSAASAFVAIASQAAYAQDVSSQDASVAAESEVRKLQTVTVTAQKRSESLQDVPIAVSAFSADDLQDRGLLGGEDLEKSVPNVSFQSNTGFGETSFQVRGIGSRIDSASADAGVGIHVNAVPITVGRFAQSEFFDVERVEVLRGPQGTLYGRNATGGVVNLITAKPEFDFSAKLNAEYGNYDSTRIGGHLNVPFSDKFAVRVAGNIIKRDGTVFNEGTGNDVESRDIWSGRLTSLYEPNESFSATLMYEHFDQEDSSGAQKGICATDPGPETIGGVPTDPFTRLLLSNGCLDTAVDDPRNNGGGISLMTWQGAWGFVNGITGPGTPGYVGPHLFAGQTFDSDLRTISAARDPLTIATNDLITLELEKSLENGLTITSISAYSSDDFVYAAPLQVGVPAQGFVEGPLTPGGIFNDPTLGPLSVPHSEMQLQDKTDQFSQELRLSSDYDGRFNFNLGGIYVDLEKDRSLTIVANTTTMFAENINLGAGAPVVFIDRSPNIVSGEGHNYLSINSDYELQAAAIFGEGYYDVTDSLKATLGLRYTSDKKKQINYVPNLYSGFGNMPGQVPLPENEVEFNELTGRFTLDWQASEDHLVYGSVSRGYKGGGFNAGNVPAGSETFDPEFVNAIEVGTKSRIAEGRGILNLTGFFYDYAGYQISRTENGVAINFNTDATIYGLELETAYQLTDNFKIDANLGYLSTEIDEGAQVNLYDLTQGDPSLTAVSSLSGPSLSTQCVLPTAEVAGLQAAINAGVAPSIAMAFLCSGAPDGSVPGSPNATGGTIVDVAGNDLPFSPEFTAAIGAQFDFDLNSEWMATLRGDYAYRSDSHSEVFNTRYGMVQSSQNLNATLTFSSEEKGLDVVFYVRNLLDEDAITSNRVFAANIGNYRQVSVKDPVLYGVRMSKTW